MLVEAIIKQEKKYQRKRKKKKKNIPKDPRCIIASRVPVAVAIFKGGSGGGRMCQTKLNLG